MEELKTLNDIEFYDKDYEEKFHRVERNIKIELKKEAIKWFRYFQSGDIKTDLQRQGIMEFILNFFNINDEDLKDGKQK